LLLHCRQPGSIPLEGFDNHSKGFEIAQNGSALAKVEEKLSAPTTGTDDRTGDCACGALDIDLADGMFRKLRSDEGRQPIASWLALVPALSASNFPLRESRRGSPSAHQVPSRVVSTKNRTRIFMNGKPVTDAIVRRAACITSLPTCRKTHKPE
jgi:hypothetical protein